MKVVTVLGARPQFIKAGSVSREIARQRSAGKPITEIVVHTGQHYDSDMSDVFFREMGIPTPNYHLGVGNKSHGAMTGQMIEKIEAVLLEQKPDWTLVYGDTNSTLAGALAASKLGIPVAHVEAGLRSFNLSMPEEVNRIVTDRVSHLLFCPTETAVENLKKEGQPNWKNSSTIILSGDVMLDGALFYADRSQQPEGVDPNRSFVLCTVHRAENTDSLTRLRGILEALKEISETEQVIFPIHPRTRKILQQSGLDTTGLSLLNPVGYLNMVWLLRNCRMVLTDSGGLQKEAFYFRKPCITLRDETEWVELLQHRFNVLAGSERQNILRIYQNFEFSPKWNSIDYGRGQASKIIVDSLQKFTPPNRSIDP